MHGSTVTHPAGFVTSIGNLGQTFVPAFNGQDRDLDVRAGFKVFNPRVYLGIGYLWRSSSYGYPQQSGLGFGLEKLPDLDKRFTPYGSAWYYPSVRGKFTDPGSGRGWTTSYGIWKYALGVNYNIGTDSNGIPGPFFLDLSFQGDRGTSKINSPGAGFSHSGPAVGVGIRF